MSVLEILGLGLGIVTLVLILVFGVCVLVITTIELKDDMKYLIDDS